MPDTARSDQLACPVCGHAYRPGELACSNCGMVFVKGGKTNLIKDPDKLAVQPSERQSSGHEVSQAAVYFEVDGQSLTLPIAENIVVGRLSDIPGDADPDVDLSAFGAIDKGVSRRHIQIRYKGFRTYVIDLGSSNGTWHNGKRLEPQVESLLHSGDELLLGKLKVIVKF